MARSLTWAGGEHDFELRIEHLRAVQDRCDAGPEWILSQLTTNQWLVDDVIQPIRLGLEGGGMEKEAARKLVAKFVEDRPLTLSVLTAQAIMLAALFGNEDDQPGELKAGAKKTRTRSRVESGNSPDTTSGRV